MEGSDYILNTGRIFLGAANPLFLIEALIRITFLYCMLVISVRLLRRGISSPPDRNILAALILIAASIGIPAQDPGKGLLPAVFASLTVIVIMKILDRWTSQKPGTAKPDVVVSDGVIDLQVMKRSGITHENVLSFIRSEGIDNLGRVKRLYFEPDGSYSITIRESTLPGLSVIPAWDKDYRTSQPDEKDMRSCTNCGFTARTSETYSGCPRCGSITWETAVL